MSAVERDGGRTGGGAEEVKSAELALSREEKRDATAVSQRSFLVLTVTFICRERSFPVRFAKISFGSGFSASLSGSSGVFENQDAIIVQMDFRCLLCLALVESFGIGWIPGAIESVEVGFVARNAFAAFLRCIIQTRSGGESC